MSSSVLDNLVAHATVAAVVYFFKRPLRTHNCHNSYMNNYSWPGGVANLYAP